MTQEDDWKINGQISYKTLMDEMRENNMAMWNPWRGCHKHSEGCRYCYIHKGGIKRGIDMNNIVKTDNFYAPIAKNKSGAYKIKSGQTVYLCFSTDFLVEDADKWRSECWQMIRERFDLHFLFLTKRIERFMDCIPEDWNDGYDNVPVGCTVENQDRADYRPSIREQCIAHKVHFEFRQCGTYFIKDGKNTPCPRVIYAAKLERQISIIE